MDSEQQQIDAEFSNEVRALLTSLPEPIRTFITSGSRDVFVEEIKRAEALPPNTALVFERDFIFLLLGILTPQEFEDSLRSANIPPETIVRIMTKIDAKVFSFIGDAASTATQGSQTVPGARPAIPKPPNSTPLIKEYVADPYREPVE